MWISEYPPRPRPGSEQGPREREGRREKRRKGGGGREGGIRKDTTGIIGWWQPSVHSDIAFGSFDVGLPIIEPQKPQGVGLLPPSPSLFLSLSYSLLLSLSLSPTLSLAVSLALSFTPSLPPFLSHRPPLGGGPGRTIEVELGLALRVVITTHTGERFWDTLRPLRCYYQGGSRSATVRRSLSTDFRLPPPTILERTLFVHSLIRKSRILDMRVAISATDSTATNTCARRFCMTAPRPAVRPACSPEPRTTPPHTPQAASLPLDIRRGVLQGAAAPALLFAIAQHTTASSLATHWPTPSLSSGQSSVR